MAMFMSTATSERRNSPPGAQSLKFVEAFMIYSTSLLYHLWKLKFEALPFSSIATSIAFDGLLAKTIAKASGKLGRKIAF